MELGSKGRLPICAPTITLVKLTQIHCFTSSGKNCMICLSVQYSATLPHSKLLQGPLLMPNSIVSFGSCQMWREGIGRVQYINRCSHTTDPATCSLCGGSDSAPYILLRYKNYTLKIMHINRHHQAVSICGEEISKGKLGSAIVTMKYYSIAISNLK